MMNYKGYIGQVEFDDEAEIFHGQVINTKDVLTFQGKSVKDLQKALKDTVEDYLEFCEELGKTPDKPFSGKFLVRVPPEVHRDLFIESKRRGVSLNTLAVERLAEK